MINILLKMYQLFFARKYFYKFNKLLYHFSLRGLGILNYKSCKETGEDYFLRNFLKKIENPIVLDVGGNIGRYAMKVKQITHRAVIYSFEPNPETFEKLSESAKKYGFKAYNFGCSDDNSKLWLYDYAARDATSHASLYKEVIENIHKVKSKNILVDLIKLDDFVLEHNIEEVDLLKIDTEGNELKVLKGFEKFITLKKIKVIQFEFNEMNVISRVFFRDFYEMLDGYEFYRMLPSGIVPLKDYNPLFCEIFAFQNIIAARKDLKLEL